MGIASMFASETNVGIQEAMCVGDHPEVREATKRVLELRAKRDETKAELRPTSELTLAAITARGEFEQAEAAVRQAERILAEVREREKARIRAARKPRELELNAKKYAALREAAAAIREYHEYRTGTYQLVGGQEPTEEWFAASTLTEEALAQREQIQRREGLLA